MNSTQTLGLQHNSTVVDGLTGGPQSREHVVRLLDAGIDLVNWTISAHGESLQVALQKIAAFYWLRDELSDLVKIVTCAAELDDTEDLGKLRVLMGFQGAEPMSENVHYVSIFHALGVRIVQLTYNEANRLGYGCLEPDDRGLTHFGIQVVRELNRLGMVVDLSHAGLKTSLDAINMSSDPVIFSHSNPRAMRDNPRNITDEQIRAVAERDGVVGIASFADFVADTREGQPNIDQFVDHISYVADLVGIDHVGIGSDCMSGSGPEGIWWNANTRAQISRTVWSNGRKNAWD